MENFENLSFWGIKVDEIPPEGITLAFEDLKDLGEDLKVLQPFSGTLRLFKRGLEVQVEGKLMGSIELTCDRCLEAFEFKIEKAFQVNLLPKKSLSFTEERELTSEDLEVSFYENSFISYLDLLREEVFLSLPYRILCREDCQGICQVCGKNLNQERCECSRDKTGSPFAVLKGLIIQEKNMEKGV